MPSTTINTAPSTGTERHHAGSGDLAAANVGRLLRIESGIPPLRLSAGGLS